MKKMKKILCAAIAMTCVLAAHAQMRINLGEDSPIRKLSIAEMAIYNLYVDSVNEKKLVEDAIRGMLEKLDPHSSYSTPKEVQALNEPLVGNFDGIGVQFNMRQRHRHSRCEDVEGGDNATTARSQRNEGEGGHKTRRNKRPCVFHHHPRQDSCQYR